jgi:phage-related protein
VNTTNGKGVYFNNFTLLAGEVITLDFERQEFTSTFRGNILSYILEGISTLDFTLEPGSNRIATFIDGTTDGNTKAVIEYKIRYWSLDEANR